MRVSKINDRRFEVALQIMQEGSSDLVYNNVSFSLDKETHVLWVGSLTSGSQRPSERSARLAIQRGIDTYHHLVTNSLEFLKAVKCCPPRFSLIEDYGMGSVELCHLENDRIIWNSMESQ